MLRLTAFFAAVLFAAPAVAITPVIDYLTPDHFQAKSAEHFLTIRGNALFVPPAVSTVIYSGGAGTFELTANAQSYTALTVWVPQEIVNRIGRYTIHVRVADAAKTLESNPAELAITGNPGPVLDLPASNIIKQATSKAGAVVEFTVSASSMVDGSPRPVTCDHKSGDTYPIGTTAIRCSATDSTGVMSEGQFSIIVVDFTGPTVHVPDDIVKQATSPKGAVVEFTVTAEDAVDGLLDPRCMPVSGSLFPIGTTTVGCDPVDAHHNSGHGEFRVTIVESHPHPILKLPDPITAEATGPRGAEVKYEASAEPGSAGEMGMISSFACTPASGSLFSLGTTTVSCTATDTQGASTTGTFTVRVADTTPPALTLPADIETNEHVVMYTATATDLVDGNVGVACTPSSGSMFATGTTSVSCSATDVHGNTGRGFFNVTVTANVDTTPPVVTSIRATPNVLEPPNHKLIPVAVAVTAVDEIDPNPVSRIVSVTGNEQMDPSDWRITGSLKVELRAERTGQEEERIYTIHVLTSDAAGNSTPSIVTVRVPHDSSSAGVIPQPAPPRRHAAGRH
jgi:hypothetical protein